MKKLKPLLLLCFILFTIFSSASFVLLPNAKDRCNCVPQQSYRLDAKHETNTAGFHKSTHVITAAIMILWETKYSAITDHIGHDNTSMTLPRQKGCPEDSIYSFDGYVYRIRTGETDCDLHLECGLINSSERVGLEITIEKCALQNKVIADLKATGFKISKDNKKGVHITAKGFGFYDGWHQKWELHPVYELEVMNN